MNRKAQQIDGQLELDLTTRTDEELATLATSAAEWVDAAVEAKDNATAAVTAYQRDLLSVARGGDLPDEHAATKAITDLIEKVAKADAEALAALTWQTAIMAEQWARKA